MLIPLLFSGLVVFITHSLEAVTGFGCSVLAMPFVTALLGMRRGIMIITILAWFLALYISITKRKAINFHQFAIICLCMGIGLPLGMYLFRHFDAILLKKAMAAFIILVSLWQVLAKAIFRKKEPRLPLNSIRALPFYIILIAGGVVHGMFSSGGPLVVIYASQALKDRGEFRATLCLLWAVLNTVIITIYLIEGSISAETIRFTGILIPFVILGIGAGEKIHSRLNEKIFSILVFGMLLIVGCFMLLL
jgi:uncharacterized membrane protein YfcA